MKFLDTHTLMDLYIEYTFFFNTKIISFIKLAKRSKNQLNSEAENMFRVNFISE